MTRRASDPVKSPLCVFDAWSQCPNQGMGTIAPERPVGGAMNAAIRCLKCKARGDRSRAMTPAERKKYGVRLLTDAEMKRLRKGSL